MIEPTCNEKQVKCQNLSIFTCSLLPIKHVDRIQAHTLVVSLSGSYMHARTHTLSINNCYDFDFLSEQNEPWLHELQSKVHGILTYITWKQEQSPE